MAYKSIEITNARAVYKQAPKTSQFYVGFSSTNIANTNSKLYDLDLIKQDLINHFNTRKGERIMNPDFGSVIWDLIMEPLTPDLQVVIQEDINAICNSDARVVPTQIKISELTTGYLVEITIQLVGSDQSANLSLNFNQNIGLLAQ
jgi:phage baseplate assembly protein W